jgi:hypothetical protein
VDDEQGPLRLGAGRDPHERRHRSWAAARPDACDPRPGDREEDDERHEDERELGAREGEHASSVVRNPCPDRAGFVPSV